MSLAAIDSANRSESNLRDKKSGARLTTEAAELTFKTSSTALGSMPALAPITKPSCTNTLAARKIWLLMSLVKVPAPAAPM